MQVCPGTIDDKVFRYFNKNKFKLKEIMLDLCIFLRSLSYVKRPFKNISFSWIFKEYGIRLEMLTR